ncbi:hypothetical protein [Flavobacterium sp.]|uniref:hypothetical protein n=1 Tax=Flavobacterium sp. TaxID=239 RepID=UPI0026255781|nr:hypothetical protein [Flavobacterium sp.]
MRKVILLFAFILCFTSCKKDPFFSNFNTIEYYQLAVEDTAIERVLIENKDSALVKTIEGTLPKSLKDEIFFSEINSDRFIKREFTSDDLNSFIDLFNSNVFLDYETAACAPNYRDFLILKRGKEVVGIVKICVRCEMHCINGIDQNKNFCGSLEYSELKKLLKKYQTQ